MTLWHADAPLPDTVGGSDRYRLVVVQPARVWMLERSPLPGYLRTRGHEFAVFVSASTETIATSLDACAPDVERAFVDGAMNRGAPVDPMLGGVQCRLARTPNVDVLTLTWRLDAHRAYAFLLDGGWFTGVVPLPADVLELIDLASLQG